MRDEQNFPEWRRNVRRLRARLGRADGGSRWKVKTGPAGKAARPGPSARCGSSRGKHLPVTRLHFNSGGLLGRYGLSSGPKPEHGVGRREILLNTLDEKWEWPLIAFHQLTLLTPCVIIPSAHD